MGVVYAPYANDANTLVLYHCRAGAGATVTDYSGNSNDGTCTDYTWNTGAITGDYKITTGGTESRIELGTALEFTGTDDFTIEGWTKNTADVVASGKIFFYHGASGEVGKISMNTNKTTGVCAGLVQDIDGNKVNVEGTTAINDGAWHHVAMTWDGSTGTASIYTDGGDVDTATNANVDNDLFRTNPHYTFGAAYSPGGGNWINELIGDFAEMRISDCVRTHFGGTRGAGQS